MKKKATKSKEQVLAENYFPVTQRDVLFSVEKEHKPMQVEITTISKPARAKKIAKTFKAGKKVYTSKFARGSSKKLFKKTSFSKSAKIEKYETPNISLKKEGYELIITEKPQAAMKIADALGSSKKESLHGIPYYEVNRQGKRIVVACAVGHLFTLTQMEKGSHFPIFDIAWVPNYLAKKADFTKKYYDTLLSLAKSAGSITIATDYDIEGEVIGMNVMRFICNQKDANRMKYSTLTKPELNVAYDSKSKSINWGQAIAGETRHYLDWFYGINLSRALMSAIKETGRFKIMSIGRVQGPTLNLIVERERKIQEFVSQKYWQVFIKAKDNKNEVELKYIKDIFDKKELKQFENIIGKTAIAETSKKEEHLPPNPPFNLTGLQMEAYRLHGMNPARTLQIAQSLYLGGLISYPRTSSQKLPDAINYKEILEKLAKQYHVEKLITKNKPIEGVKTDSAHPSIYPTGEMQQMNEDEEKIYNLVVRRFLCLFCDDAIIDNKTITAKITLNRKIEGQENLGVLTFNTKGAEVKKKAWLDIYPYKIKEIELPDMNGEVKIIDSRTEEKETQPPKRYSPASIVSELEKRNLGTKATRAAIVETLYDRGYVKEKSIEATPLGISLIETLEKYSPIIIDEELTRNFEKEIDDITESKKDFLVKEKKVVEEAKEAITKISKDFEKNKKSIGNELISAESQSWEKEKENNKLNVCPLCQKGNLAITYSRKTRRSFIACNAYPACKKTYSLPPNGLIKKTDKLCEHCGFPMLMSLRKGKKPWIFCFNNECELNKKILEEYREKIEKEQKNQQEI
jgi:DNA topoisomerase-1